MKTAEELKQIYTANYLHQGGEITSKELGKRLTIILESYAKKQAVEFAEWFATVSHLDLRTSSTWENVYDEFIKQQS